MREIITIKTDRVVKKNSQRLAGELGLALSDVINAALRNFIRTREVYISAVPQATPELERLIGVVERDIAAKRNLSPVFPDIEKAIAYLKNTKAVSKV